MPDWFAVTGAIINGATALDMGYRYRPTEIVYGKDAGDLLSEVDEILKHSNSVLENHKDIMDENMYEGLRDKYRTFHWQMADESQGHRAIRDQIIRQSRILSQLYASEESRQSRAQTLLASVEQYQTEVLTASQAAHRAVKGKGLAMFPDVKNPPNSTASSSKSFTSWLSAFSGAGRNLTPTDLESVGSPETPSMSDSSVLARSNATSVNEGGFTVSVTHYPYTGSSPDSTSAGPGGEQQPSGLWHRTIRLESGGKQMEIPDPTLHRLTENGACIDEKSLQSILVLCQRFFEEQNGGATEGSQVNDSAPDVSLESTIETFKKMST